MKWELEAENKLLSDNERSKWLEARKRWLDKESEYASMLRQKARVKWDAEGDENSKFFHAYVKRKNNKNNIRGLMVNGLRCEDPTTIKAEMAGHYKGKFSENEVWDAVRRCGGDKSQDGFNFKFIRKLWDLLKPEFMLAVNWFWDKTEISRGSKLLAKRVKGVVGKVVGDVQNAFIKGRFILDGILIANETVEYLKRKKEKGLIFKVDFEKSYDTTMSILVNGPPTEWFNIKRGVRQGDPLSPFLFIHAAEGLNAIVNEAVEKGIFRGVRIGNNRVVVSHLQYEDDTIFFGEWNKENARSLMCILKCFEEVSGLRVNYNKSKLYGVGVNEREIEDMARWMRCEMGKFPFTYLGLPIGENMRRVAAWNPVIDKFKKRFAD
ncbi:putative ribonuclease H protein [Tanacetum coccineum]